MNWRRYRDPLYPALIHSAMWASLLTLFAVTSALFYPVSATTLFLIVLAVVSFSTGCLIITTDHAPFRDQFAVEDRTATTSIVPGVLAAFALLSLPFFIHRAIEIVDSGGAVEFYAGLRTEVGQEGAHYGAFVLSMWAAFAAAAMYLFRCLTSTSKLRDRVLLMATCLLATIYAVLFTGRNFVFFLAVLLIGIAVVMRKLNPVRTAVATFIFGLALFATYEFLLQSLGLSLSDFGSESASTLAQDIAMYLIGPIAAFDSVVRTPQHWAWGIHLFRDLGWLTQKLGWNEQMPELVQPFIYVGPSGNALTNVYTSLQMYFVDFGTFGVAFFSLLLGLWHGYVYRKATTRQPHPLWFFVYAMFLYPLLMSYSVENYFHRVNRWIIFAVLFASMYSFHPRPRHTARLALGHASND